MTAMSRAEVVSAVAVATGLTADDVTRFFEALAQLAYAESHKGFLLPGFGKFIVRQGEAREAINPFTGEPALLRGRMELQFEVDTTAHDRFLEETHSSERPSELGLPPEVLPAIRLHGMSADPTKPIPAEPVECGQLGGEPDWIQGPEEPTCCATPMKFYAQLDSRHLPSEFNLVDGGSLYVFYCDGCFKVMPVLQFY